MASYTIPYVTERTDRGERTSDIFSRLLTDRIVYLGSEIDDGVANVIIAQLLHLNALDADAPINVYINSPGGSVTAMFGVYDAMQFLAAPIRTTCVGQAASTAAVLFAAGQPGHRLMLRHARVLLHPPATEGRGALPDLAIQAAEIQRVRAQLEQVLADHTGQSVDRIRHDTQRDRIFTAAEAIDYGLADTIVGGP